MLERLSLVMLVLTGSALAQDKPAEASAPVFEMFRLVPGQAEAFIRSMALWDKVSIAGNQPPTQLFLHAGGEGWDVLLYKPARPTPTPAQEAAMATKIKELGLATGALYFLEIREQMADHTRFEATGPTTAQQWLEELDRQRAEMRQEKMIARRSDGSRMAKRDACESSGRRTGQASAALTHSTRKIVEHAVQHDYVVHHCDKRL